MNFIYCHRSLIVSLLFVIVCQVATSGILQDKTPPSVKVTEESGPGGVWKSKIQWKAHWVQHWEIRKMWIPIWRKIWGPLELKEWIPLPKPPPTWSPPLH